MVERFSWRWQLTAVQGVQEHTHAELSHLRDERDDAIKALHDTQLEAKDWETREERWKAAVSRTLWHLILVSEHVSIPPVKQV